MYLYIYSFLDFTLFPNFNTKENNVIPSFLPYKMPLIREWNRHTKNNSAGKKKVPRATSREAEMWAVSHHICVPGKFHINCSIGCITILL